MPLRPIVILAGMLIFYVAPALQAAPLADQVDTSVRDCRKTDTLHVPLTSSGTDLVPLLGNGYASKTKTKSIFGQQKLSVVLARKNQLVDQLNAYMVCKSPILRLTQGQMELAASVTEKDPRTHMIAFYQHGWSTGSDVVVARSNIQKLSDLSGATIALQEYGPQVDLLATAIDAAKKQVESSGGSWQKPKLVFTKNETGFEKSAPSGRFSNDSDIDAALVFKPDADVLTSGGNTGSGAEGSVKGAHVVFSTRSANRAVSEIYAVRSDFMKANPELIKRFVSALFSAEVRTREDVKKLIVDWKATGRYLLDDPSAVEAAKTMWASVETSGMQGNVDWSTEAEPRSFEHLNTDLSNVLVPLGLLDGAESLAQADLDYPALAKGVFDKRRVELASFNKDAASKMVEKQRRDGKLDEKTIASFEIHFKPNQQSFPVNDYEDEFDTIINAASKYGGAVLTVEGHADPLGYLKKKANNASLSTLRSIRQAARNLSRGRAVAVRDQIIKYAGSKGVSLDPSQFVVEGLGFSEPRIGVCGGDPCPPKTRKQWLSNMRVKFRAVRVAPESSTFTPPNSW